MADTMIYLDHAAATPVSDAVLAAMQPYWQLQFYNPSATYLPARDVRTALRTARQSVAEIIGARASEIVFTAGGTEANNLAIQGVMAQYPDANMVTTAVEHESVLETAKTWSAQVAPVQPNGIADVGELLKLLDDRTVLVSVMYANNEVGSVQPLRDIGAAIAEIRVARRAAGNKLPLLFHTDAAQAANYLDLHVARLGVDLMTLNGGKIYGPKQSGVLYVRGGVVLAPLVRGGGQEHGLRSGTENVAAAIGFSAALTETAAKKHDEISRLQTLQKRFFKEVKAQLPEAVVNGSTSRRLPNNLHITLPGTDNERALLQLEEKGMLAAAGSACSASSEAASHVLLAMGVSEADARSSLRFTMGRATTEQDIDRLLGALAEIAKA
jgi:cysteine desulfurase